jgi:hypothetical protein
MEGGTARDPPWAGSGAPGPPGTEGTEGIPALAVAALAADESLAELSCTPRVAFPALL